MPETPDLTDHPGVEVVHFGEASGIPGLHQPPAVEPVRRKRSRPARTGKPAEPDGPAAETSNEPPAEATTSEEDA